MNFLFSFPGSGVVSSIISVIAVLLFIALVLFLITLFLIAPGRGADELRRKFHHLNLAHRGLHSPDKKIPENSLAAFRAATEAGYGIELDLQLTKDEQIVVFHDDTLNRVCGIDNRVDFYTYDELKEFRLCGTEEQIPLFTEVLAAVDGRVPLLVELKNGPKNPLLCQKTLELLRSYKGLYCIESFSPFIVGWFKKNAPDILRGQLSAPSSDFKGVLSGPVAFALSHLLTNVIARPHFTSYHKEGKCFTVKLCESMGAMKFVWTVRPGDNIKRLEEKNDAVIFEFYAPAQKY